MNKRAFALGAVMILLGSLVAVALRSFAEATFLGAYGPTQMPWLLIATAGGFAVATLGYDAVTRLAHARAVDLGLLVALVAIAGLAPTLLGRGVSPAVLVVALTAASQVANLALWNRVAASVAGRDARRMLPRAGAAVTAGGVIAGLGAGAIIPRVGLASLPYIGAVATIVVIFVWAAQDRALVTGGAPGGAPGAIAVGPPASLSTVQHKLVTAMIVVAALEAIVTTVIDLQFIGTVKGRYTGDAVAVALSLFYGGTNLVLLLLQLGAVPRLLVTRSLPFTAAIHPVLVILSYLGFVASPGFVGIAGTRTTDQVLRLATSRTSQELALSALPPAPRARWKVLLRGLVWPAGASAAAGVLFAIGPTDPARLAGAAIAIAIVWGIAARVAAKRFQTALAAPLGMRAVRRDDPRRIDLETLERWTHAAGADDPKQAALARATLARARVDATDLADHLRHDDPEVRAAMFDQLARMPAPALRGELRAALAIEDDDRALALAIKALTMAGDDGGIARGKQRVGLSREVDQAVASAAAMLQAADAGPLDAELAKLVARDPAWATAIIRARRAQLPDDMLDTMLRTATQAPETRAGALRVIACAGVERTLELLAGALEVGDAAALAALEELDGDGAIAIGAALPRWSALARATVARALAGAPAGGPLIAQLVDDRDPEVAYAALRTALAVARGGGVLPAARIAAAHDAALASLIAYLDARDATAELSACAKAELDIATRRCVARVLWASAVEAAANNRDPAPIAAMARHLTGAHEADRKRALDVVQELQARPQILEAIERWLRAPGRGGTTAAIATTDPWLGRLFAGELAALEPRLVGARRPALFASIAGPALAALAERATAQTITGTLFEAGAPGDAMYVVVAGALVARRPPAPDRRLELGSVVGELAVLTHAPRAATVVAAADGADVLAIDRQTFAAASRRSPELVLGLSATLAGWLAPNRPDVL